MENNKVCKYCGGNRIRKNGYTDTGKQRYLCLDTECRKSFVDDDARSDGQAYKLKCEYCAKIRIFTKYGFNFVGNQRLKCTVCKHTKSIDEKREE